MGIASNMIRTQSHSKLLVQTQNISLPSSAVFPGPWMQELLKDVSFELSLQLWILVFCNCLCVLRNKCPQ